MSKVTINLNSIINTLCANRFDTLENRIASACESIFNYNYIDDEEQRKNFEMLFCTTYIERDIYTPSVALWRLQLKNELLARAPMINKKIELLKTELNKLGDVTESTTVGTNKSLSSGSGSSENKSMGSRYPQDLLRASELADVTHAEQGSRNEGSTEQESYSEGEGSSNTVTTNINLLVAMREYNNAVNDLILRLVDELYYLFLMTY